MKKLLFCSSLLILLGSAFVLTVEAASMWVRTYGGAGVEWACSVLATSDGGYVIAGTGDSFGFSDDFWLVKTDSNGAMEWNRTYGGSGNDVAAAIVATPDGGYAIAGTWNDSKLYGGAYYGDFWLVKTDSLGNIQWHKTYSGVGLDKACSLVTTSDGGYAIAGTRNYSTTYAYNFHRGGDFWLIKTDSSGNVEWNKTYGGAGNDVASSLIETSDGGFALAGTWNYTGYHGLWAWGDFWIVKTDALGNMLWNGTYKSSEDERICENTPSLVEASDGGFVLAGEFSNFGGAWVVKIDPGGSPQWNLTYLLDVPPFLQQGASIVKVSDGGYAVAGYFNNLNEAKVGYWIAKINTMGDLKWNQTTHVEIIPSQWRDGTWSFITTSDGGYALAGIVLEHPFSTWSDDDFVLIKTNEFGIYPEYTSWLVPALIITATTLMIIKNRKRGKK